MTAVHQLFHQIENQIHVFGYFRMDIGIHHIQTMGIRLVLLNIAFRKFHRRNAFLICTADDFIIDIRKILHIGDIITTILQIPPQYVKRTNRTGIADMNIVVNRWPTRINADMIRFDGDELLFFSGQCVINLHMDSSSFL